MSTTTTAETIHPTVGERHELGRYNTQATARASRTANG